MERKKNLYKIALVLVVLIFPFPVLSTDFSSTSFTVKDPGVDQGLGRSTSTNFGLGQSLGQVAIGRSTSSSYQLWSGFQYFFQVNANTLTATAGNGQVSLSWTVPSTFLGASVGGYDLGTGTVSGSYTFESMGNVTSYSKTGLTNGTIYYFIIKAKTAAGTFLVFSNEASATPTGTGATGGGGGFSIFPAQASILIKGWTAPRSAVTILRSGVIAGATVSDEQGFFSSTLSNLTVGSYAFGVYAVDSRGSKTLTYNFAHHLSAGVVSSIEIIVSPTIRLSHSIVRLGEDLTVSGFAAPQSPVSLFFDAHLKQSKTSQSNGFWEISIETSNIGLGVHEIAAQVAKSGKTSPQSRILEFEVSQEASQGESIGIPEEQMPQVFSGRSDLNSDERVDLVDFSILIYYWQQAVGTENPADINKSGIVDLVDFSILLYEWTG